MKQYVWDLIIIVVMIVVLVLMIIDKRGTVDVFQTTAISNSSRIFYYGANGRPHREDGPAFIFVDGAQLWYLNDLLHREDGPAIIYADGTQMWFINGKRHRLDGPAIIWTDGSQFWYLNDLQYSFEEFLRQPEITNEIRAFLLLKYVK